MPSEIEMILNSHKVSEWTRQTLEAVKLDIIRNMGLHGRNASGRSVASLDVKINGIGGTLYGLSSFLTMETGRKGGRVPKGFQQIIADWIVAKGIPLRAQATLKGRTYQSLLHSTAFLIARKIRQSGTMLHRNGHKQDIFSKSALAEVDRLAERMNLSAASCVDYLNKEFAKTK